MMMKNPCHPGEIIREEVLAPLGLTVTQAAKALGVTRQALSNMLNGVTSLTAEMALRVEKAFGPKMEHLMRMQLNYDRPRPAPPPIASRLMLIVRYLELLEADRMSRLLGVTRAAAFNFPMIALKVKMRRYPAAQKWGG